MALMNHSRKNIIKHDPHASDGDHLSQYESAPTANTGLNSSASEQAQPFFIEKSQATEEKSWLRRKSLAMIQSVNDWSYLQKNIRAFPDRIKTRMREIERQFYIYRLTYTNITYKAPRVEEEIWGIYNSINEKIPHLEKRTRQRPLFLYTNSGLRDLNQAWENLSSMQDALSRMLEIGPRKQEFYNRMLIYREEKRQLDRQRRRNENRINAAYEAVKKALNYVERQTQGNEPIYFGNEILTLDEVKAAWNGTIEDLLSQRSNPAASTEEIVSRMRLLEETIRDFPTLAKHIQRSGERFNRIISYHDLLLQSGKRIIPQPEIARATVMMYEQVPEQWARGNFQELKITLERVENFLNFYENSVELEIAVGERRRSGFSQNSGLTLQTGNTALSPLISLARVLVNAIDQRDRFMVGHSEKVASLSLATGKKLNWSQTDLEFLELAALLHDVGKISIPETVLTKVKPLTPEEWKTIQMHPFYGAQIIKQIDLFDRIIPWVYHHQEHWDGTGYPEHIGKEEIPKAASIIGVNEAFTAMTADIPYRQSLSRDEAVELIKQDSEKQFDPEVVEAFSEVIKDQAAGEISGKE